MSRYHDEIVIVLSPRADNNPDEDAENERLTEEIRDRVAAILAEPKYAALDGRIKL